MTGKKKRMLRRHGSCLAVTAQSPTVAAPLNARPVAVSVDESLNASCTESLDRVRNFTSLHVGGACFLLGDGSVRFAAENINAGLYRGLDTIQGGEVIGEY